MRSLGAAGLLAIASIGAVATPTFAQTTSAPDEPRVSKLYPVWVGYGLLTIFGLAILGVSLMPSKRAHQD